MREILLHRHPGGWSWPINIWYSKIKRQAKWNRYPRLTWRWSIIKSSSAPGVYGYSWKMEHYTDFEGSKKGYGYCSIQLCNWFQLDLEIYFLFSRIKRRSQSFLALIIRKTCWKKSWAWKAGTGERQSSTVQFWASTSATIQLSRYRFTMFHNAPRGKTKLRLNFIK